MLMVLRPEMEAEAQAIFRKWGLDFAVVGHTTDTLRFVVRHHGETMADLPIKQLGDMAPEYDRPHTGRPARLPLDPATIPPPADLAATLLDLVGSPDLCSRRWVWEQYDHLIQGNTVRRPGGDAAVVRVDGTHKGLAMSVDVTPRYCFADPFEGGKQAVAECWRNLTASGALPIALTDNLNFGNPEKPEIMGELVGCIRGIGEAARALDFPVVSGNVSLYNETLGEAILPTPAIGGVGLLDDVATAASAAFARSGDAVYLVGGHGSHLGASIYLRDVLGRDDGAPPPVDLERERRHGDFVRAEIRAGRASAVHDLSDGGLAITLAEMAMASGIGVTVAVPAPAHVALFAEDQARYVVTVAAGDAGPFAATAAAAGVTVERLGTTGGTELIVQGEIAISVANLKARHEDWMPRFMQGKG
jgi:phosphoribosylformylglycinamidine synthase